VAGTAAAHTIAGGGAPQSRSIDESVDVLVVGGGAAGVPAAIQAARLGASVLLMEMGSQLGGTTTTGGVDFPGLFHAWTKQIISGIGWDLVTRTVELGDGVLPDFSTPPERHWQHQIRINGQLYAALAEEECIASGVALCYYEIPRSGRLAHDGWQIECCGKGVRRRVTCRQLVDCTGGADVVGMLGYPRMREDETQPGTMIMRFEGYDVSALDGDEVERRYRRALEDGELLPGDYAARGGRFMQFLAGGGANANHIFGADSSTSITKTDANVRGRAAALRLLRFIRSLPGCEAARIARLQPEAGVRETYRIEGETIITHQDYTSGRSYPDGVCHSFYPIDLHTEEGVTPKPLTKGTVPVVPLRALLPKGSRRLLAAGRSVSSDRLANSALRVQASCMAMGQAAGAAAALSARKGVSPIDLDVELLRHTLVAHGAIVPG
jgi:hypothetical protein